MNRSNSVSSTSSNRNSTAEPFAYQTRLLERTTSLSRAGSQSIRGVLASPTTPTTLRRKWTQSHRVTGSVDTLRGKWEDRARAEAALEGQFTGTDSIASHDTSSSTSSALSAGSLSNPYDTLPSPTTSFYIAPPALVDPPIPSLPIVQESTPPPPPPAKRFNFPPPIIASPLSPTRAPPIDTSNGTLARQNSTTSIASRKRFSAYSFTTPMNDKPTDASHVRSRRSVDFDAMFGSRNRASDAPPTTPTLLRSNTSLSSMPLHKPNRPPSIVIAPDENDAHSLPTPEDSPRKSFQPLLPASSSVMSPTPFRSSYMASKKSYGDHLVVGRRLGRHLPRIASGDGPDEPPSPEKPRQPLPDVTPEPAKPDHRTRQARRAKQLKDLEATINASSVTSNAPLSPTSSSASAHGDNDVAGIPGRIRLSKGTMLSATAMPLPSSRMTRGLWADTQRHLLQAYEYLCHVGEAQQWIEGCLGEELGFGVVEMEDELVNGVVLAKLVRVFEPSLVRRIYEAPKLDFRHSDNINCFFIYIRRVGLPDCFIFELIDLYNKKNMPKVIYCIHALSHLLARRGLAERIGNLLGQLKFSDDQLQQADNGLKAAGVAMPNFGNVGRDLAKEIDEEPEVEPEAEEERRDRLLLENEDSIVALQSLARGFLARKAQTTKLGRVRLATERYLPRLHARCRGILVRRQVDLVKKQHLNLVPWATSFQALLRGALVRRKWKNYLDQVHAVKRVAIKLQAQGRGVLQRRRFAKLKAALTKSNFSVVKLQSISRARLARRSHQQVHKTLEQIQTLHGVVSVQALARGFLTRQKRLRRLDALHGCLPQVTALQAQIRGVLVRRRVGVQLARLDDAVDVVIRIQAASRCFLARKRLLRLIRGLREASPSVVKLQALVRAKLARRRHMDLRKALAHIRVVSAVGSVQSLARAAIMRKRQQQQQKEFKIVMPDVLGLQATLRGELARWRYWAWRNHLYVNQPVATALQALLRGVLERRKFSAKMRYYKDNLDKVVKIQSLFRAKETREQYRQLTLGKNVNVGTIKNFVHLLDDSEADFEDEIEVERLRKRVVEGIRGNQALETEVNELDVRIALVVQNVKSFEDLVKARRGRADSIAAHTSRASVLAAHGDPFAGSNTLDHATKRKLELYQQLFYLLQTRPEYPSCLLSVLSRDDVLEKNRRLAERVLLTLFGYGQEAREEYLFLKFFQLAVQQEVASASTITEIIHGHPIYMNVAVHYIRAKQVSYVRDTLQAMIKEVVDQEELDLETDPSVIYRRRINNEEMRSGVKTNKPASVSFHQAVQDVETRIEFIRNLQKLFALTKNFLEAITGSTKKMPYGMRCIARETLAAVKIRFPHDTDEAHAACVGRLVYYRFINPAILTPETFDIVPHSIGVHARRNLGEISKMLTQISSGSEFSEENSTLAPLNDFVASAIKQSVAWLIDVASVDEAETRFQAHEFLDATAQPKPIYISPNEVYSMHSLLSQNLDVLAATRDDPLRTILVELGGVPHFGNDELNNARDRAVTLVLTNRFSRVNDAHADEKALWVQAKRTVLAILRVQPAKDLVESLMQPVSDEHESFWEDIIDREMLTDRMRQRQRRMPSSTGKESAYRLEDIQSLSFAEVKAHAIYFLVELEKMGRVTRADGYQGILNAIAGDVRSKHRKRLQRQQELANMQDALRHLTERKKYFEEQIASYHNYVETAMNTLQRGKGKKRFVMPFTKQFYHLRELHKSGKSPQFGSFRYGGQDLYDKGILLSVDQYSPRQFDRVDFVLSSNKPGVFLIELYDNVTTNLIAETEIRMEELLQAQFENQVSFALFGNMAKFNLNLLLYQINKKFYV